MATRRQGREWAIQLLFELDLNPGEVETVLARFFETYPADARTRAFTEAAVRGVMAHREALDGLLRQYARNWDLRRMGVIERNVLRLGLYELRYCGAIPPAVVINEAVDIAKYFSMTESGKFVNGILDRARKELGAAGRVPGASAS
ncbi:MAG: transcription antitermination factor NusB [Lentisphaerae bacterium]|nr:transcription antitermination factor NusB [Lentisphaerota bacterium]